jgi:hypothetical protein
MSAHRLLPDLHLTLYAAQLPIHADMQRICQTSPEEAWSDKRSLFGDMADIKM